MTTDQAETEIHKADAKHGQNRVWKAGTASAVLEDHQPRCSVAAYPPDTHTDLESTSTCLILFTFYIQQKQQQATPLK